MFGVQGDFETTVLYISISISVLSVASVVYSTQLNGVPFSNGTSEKTRMFQRYQVLYPQPFALTYELSLNHNPGWRRFRSDGSSCSFLPLWPRPVIHLKNLNPNPYPNFRSRPIAKCLTLAFCGLTEVGSRVYLFANFAMAFKVLALPHECVDSNPDHLLSFIQQGIALLCLLAYCLLVGAMYGRNAQTEEYSLDQFAQVPMIDIISENDTYEYTHLSMATGAHHGGTDQHGGVLRSAAGAGSGIDEF